MTRPPYRRKVALSLTLWALALLLAACGTASRDDDPSTRNAAPKRFHNNYLSGGIAGSFLKWQWERHTQGLPKPPANGYHFPLLHPDVGWLKANRSQTAVTWIGHATTLVQLAGVNILTDPILSERAFPVQFLGPKRKVPPALTAKELPHIDVVLISHNHYDHLDRDTVHALNAQPGGPPLFLVPLGVKQWMADEGITHVRELNWWEHTAVKGLRIDFLPVQHWSARGIFDRFETLWGGWAVRSDGQPVDGGNGTPDGKPFSFFFAGDTGYSKDFRDIDARFHGFDLALLPIGAYAPRWFMHKQHVNPAEAVQIMRDVHAKQAIAIHWGTFELSDESLDQPPKDLAAALRQDGIPADRFLVLKHGETRRFPGAVPVPPCSAGTVGSVGTAADLAH